jgi:hypothetical protein
MLQQHQPDRRHSGGVRHLLGVHELVDRGAVQFRARHHQLGAHRRGREGDAPAIGMEQGNHRKHCISRGGAERILRIGHQGMQHVGAMGIQHALGIAGRAGGVAHRSRGVLVEGFPGKVAVALRDPVFIRDCVLQRGLRHMSRIRQHDVALDARQLVGDLLQDRHEGEVGQHHAILRMVDDPGDLLRKQARIDRVADRADSHDAVPGFQMARCIPRNGGDAVADRDAVARQQL